MLGRTTDEVRAALGSPAEVKGALWIYEHLIGRDQWTRVLTVADGHVKNEDFQTRGSRIESSQTRAWLDRSGQDARELSVVGFSAQDVPELLGPPTSREGDESSTTLVYEWKLESHTVRREVRLENGRASRDTLRILFPDGDDINTEDIGGAPYSEG